MKYSCVVTGSNLVKVLNFQAFIRNCKNCVHNCEDHSLYLAVLSLVASVTLNNPALVKAWYWRKTYGESDLLTLIETFLGLETKFVESDIFIFMNLIKTCWTLKQQTCWTWLDVFYLDANVPWLWLQIRRMWSQFCGYRILHHNQFGGKRKLPPTD